MELIKQRFIRLEKDLLRAWQAAHGVDSGKASTLAGPDRLAFLIEGAFSQADWTLSEVQEGETLIRQYALELLNQSCIEKALDVERATGSKIRSRDVNVNLDANQILLVFTFDRIETKETGKEGHDA